MSDAPPGAPTGNDHRIERLQTWIAWLLTALLHLAWLLLALLVPPMVVAPPDGDDAAGGSRVEVNFIGDRLAEPAPDPDPQPSAASDPSDPSAAASRLRTTPAVTPLPLPPDAHVVSDSPATASRPRPSPSAPQSAPRPPPSGRRPGHVWGQPPGMAPRESAPVNSGTAPSPAVGQGRRASLASDQPSLEVGGYQVVYELSSETRLRAWQEQGMTEVFIPLPGTRKLMICPLETALKRESGPCRQLDPGDPELATIGDAREVIAVRGVYHQGELVWRGPGAYR